MIYILEDDDEIREIECYALKNSGFEVEGFSMPSKFREQVKAEVPELVLLDIMLPGDDGLAILKELKTDINTAAVPVILVTARSTELDTVKGFDTGADDYISKPFGVMELVSRVKARIPKHQNIKKNPEDNNSIYEFEGIRLNDEQHVVTAENNQIELTYKEYELLKLLLSVPGKAFGREYIMEKIWGYDYEGNSRTLDMHIKTLRQKLGKKGSLIQTVRNVGFKIDNNN